MNQEISNWEARLSPALNYEATLKQIERSTKDWEDQKAKVNDLETLCVHFGKDGIKAELIAKHIGVFSETVNGVLSIWGYSAKLEIEPYSFLVTTPKGELPLKELSGSEKMMFAVALQTAIAVHSKIRFIVVDKLDTMVHNERSRAFMIVKKLIDNGTLEQAILLLSEKEPKAINQPGVGTYWIEEGRIQRL